MKRKAFTLVELLVVIAIISILAGMLMPALERALGQARSISCVNNQKQISLNYLQYGEENEDWFPPIGSYNTPAYLSGMAPHNYTYGQIIQAGVFATDLTGIYLCPNAEKVDEEIGFYKSSYKLLAPLNESLGIYSYDVKTSNIPPNSVIMCDGKLRYCNWGVDNVFASAVSTASAKPAGANKWAIFIDTVYNVYLPNYYSHEMSANFMFADGHVQSLGAGTLFEDNWTLK